MKCLEYTWNGGIDKTKLLKAEVGKEQLEMVQTT